jgi:OmpA-OmpF porin, OOP family
MFRLLDEIGGLTMKVLRSPSLLALSLFLLSLISPLFVHAASGYVGAGFGSARPTVDKGSVEFHTQDWSPDVSVWRVFAGYQISENFGAESGYINLGKARVATEGGDFFETTMTGFDVTSVASLPIGKAFSVFARGGLVFWQSDIKYHFTALGEGGKKKSGSNLTVSFGARYALTKRIGARAEYSLYAIDKSKAGAGDYKVISLAGLFMF